VQEIDDIDKLRAFAVAEVDGGSKIVSLVEKPAQPQSRLAVFAIYFYTKDTVSMLRQYLGEGNNPDAPGYYPQWLYTRKPVYASFIEGECHDIGTVESYMALSDRFIK
jgi:glucose-1-phosphate thymidylyltransferase